MNHTHKYLASWNIKTNTNTNINPNANSNTDTNTDQWKALPSLLLIYICEVSDIQLNFDLQMNWLLFTLGGSRVFSKVLLFFSVSFAKRHNQIQACDGKPKIRKANNHQRAKFFHLLTHLGMSIVKSKCADTDKLDFAHLNFANNSNCFPSNTFWVTFVFFSFHLIPRRWWELVYFLNV